MNDLSSPAIYEIGTARKVGFVHIVGRKLVFTEASGTETVAWDEYSIKASIKDEMLVIRSAVEKNQRLYIKELRFSEELSRKMNVRAGKGPLASFSDRDSHSVVMAGVGFAVLLAGLLIFVHHQGYRMAPYVSAEQKTELKKEALSQFKDRLVDVSPELQGDWDRLLGRLFSIPELSHRQWDVRILRTKQINACALPGGVIVMFSGLIMRSQSPEEILAVLAHEAGHVTHGHVIEKWAGYRASRWVGFLLPGWMRSLDQLDALRYSRSQEAEADRLALHYLAQARVSTKGFYDFFERAGKSQKRQTKQWMNWVSSHPPDARRLEAIRNFRAPMRPEPVDFPLAKFQSYLSDVTGARRYQAK